MRCKKHPTDLSSTVGVCASCLRERLIALIAAQAKAQQQPHLSQSYSRATASDDHRRKPELPPLVFPRSVSPYVARRKSDDNHAWPSHHLFYSTPQVGPTYTTSATTDFTSARSFQKKHTRFSLFSNLFRSRSEKLNSDPKASDLRVSPRDSCDASSSPSSWFSTIFFGRRKKQSTLFYIEDALACEQRRCPRMDRGMSPAREADLEELETTSSAEVSPQMTKRTPVTGPGGVRRTRQVQGRNVSGLGFCLSPLVRPSPNRAWSHKCGMPPDMGISGEIRVAMKPHISTAAAFCANRSRKLADFGRVNQKR